MKRLTFAFSLYLAALSLAFAQVGLPWPGPGTHAASAGCTLATPALSASAFTGGGAGSSVIGVVTETPTGCTFAAGALSITGANSGGFLLSTTASPANLTCPVSACPAAGTYADFQIVATLAAASNSPQSLSPSLTGSGAFVTWNPADKSADVVLSNTNHTATQSTVPSTWRSARSTTSHTSGLYYFEFTCTSVDTGGPFIGFGTSALSLSSFAGSDLNSYGFQPSGKVFHNSVGSSTALFATCYSGNTFGIAVNLGTGLVWIHNVTAGLWNVGSTGAQDPNAASPQGGIPIPGLSGSVFLVFSGYDGGPASAGQINGGSSAYLLSGGAPAGYGQW